MHRKIVVIDDRIAFVGGINYSAEHMSDYGPQAKQDYAVRVEGPVVAISCNSKSRICGAKPRAPLVEAPSSGRRKPPPGEAQALFVWRDNEEHRDDIERHYLKMLTQAKREVDYR
ncbi:phospholipase [Salmonella enterica subsp. enterica serovar Pullorum]|nr:phospholipase [Salmonella enterica subsp. enterica serovar Pullorum]